MLVAVLLTLVLGFPSWWSCYVVMYKVCGTWQSTSLARESVSAIGLNFHMVCLASNIKNSLN